MSTPIKIILGTIALLILLLSGVLFVRAILRPIAQAIVYSPADCLKTHELAHAGGWPADHPNAIYTKHCGQLPMPPRSFPIRGQAPIIHYVPGGEMFWHCGYAQACSDIGGNPSHIWLPRK